MFYIGQTFFWIVSEPGANGGNNPIERIPCWDDHSLTNERPCIFCVQPMAIGGAYADIDL